MARTKGGNPGWTREEVILALDLYLDFDCSVPSVRNTKVEELSNLLRACPIHDLSKRNEAFRNPDSVVFKLNNIRQVHTEDGLKNVAKVDRLVFAEFGTDQVRTKIEANQIRDALFVLSREKQDSDPEFDEGGVRILAHKRRERSRGLRDALIKKLQGKGALSCAMCGCKAPELGAGIDDAIFEVHHRIPISHGDTRKTRLEDVALLCANCHRIIHRRMAIEKRWIDVIEGRVS